MQNNNNFEKYKEKVIILSHLIKMPIKCLIVLYIYLFNIPYYSIVYHLLL